MEGGQMPNSMEEPKLVGREELLMATFKTVDN